MPRLKNNIKISRIRSQKLVEDLVLRNQKTQNTRPRLVVWSLGIGFLVGGILLGFLYFSRSPAEAPHSTEIILPQSDKTEESDNQRTNEQIPLKNEPLVTLQRLVILDTPTGFLNVREGPGITFKKISQLNPGERYEIIGHDENAGWYQIRLQSGQAGWVINEYIKIE